MSTHSYCLQLYEEYRKHFLRRQDLFEKIKNIVVESEELADCTEKLYKVSLNGEMIWEGLACCHFYAKAQAYDFIME